MLIRYLAAALVLSAVVVLGADEKYTGPRPAKPDVLNLVHADNLVETEVLNATQEEKGTIKLTDAWCAHRQRGPMGRSSG
jgi:hypothetical protein